MPRRRDLPKFLPMNAPHWMWTKFLKGLDEQKEVAKAQRDEKNTRRSRVRQFRAELGPAKQVKRAVEFPSPIAVQKLARVLQSDNGPARVKAANAILHLGRYTEATDV